MIFFDYRIYDIILIEFLILCFWWIMNYLVLFIFYNNVWDFGISLWDDLLKDLIFDW